MSTMWESVTSVETPNELLARMKQFLISECKFTLIKDITDDLDIATSTFVDGQLCVVRDKLNKYYIIMRSANDYNIYGNSYTIEEDKQKNTAIKGIGITMTTEYDGTIPLWYNQKNVPLYFHNNYIVKYGIFLPMMANSPNLLYCNYVEDYDMNTKASPYTCMFSITSDGPMPEFDRWYFHAIFGNLKLYNIKNIDSIKNGGFMLSSIETQQGNAEAVENKIKVGGAPVKQKQKIKDAHILPPTSWLKRHNILDDNSLAHLNITYGDYDTQRYNLPYTFIETDIKENAAQDEEKEDTNKVDPNILGNVWATSRTMTSSGFDPKGFLRLVMPLSPENTGAINLRNMVNASIGNANTITHVPRTFGLPIILGINTNPIELNQIAPVGEVFGLYFISMYNYNGASCHAIPCYEGIIYTQVFPTYIRSASMYSGIAISNSYAFPKVYQRHSDPYGGGLGL